MTTAFSALPLMENDPDTAENAPHEQAARPALALFHLDQSVEGRIVRYADHPITFEEYVDIESDERTELVQGVLETIMSAPWPHEAMFIWLITVMNGYARHCKFGVVSGSRYAVKIDMHSGRLPNIQFIRQDRLHLIKHKGLEDPPDLVVEIVSPHDRPGYLREVEADYRQIGVPEIVFIDPQIRNVRVVLRQADGGYTIDTITSGDWRSTALPNFHVALMDLFDEPRPDELETTLALVAEAGCDNPRPKMRIRRKQA